MSNSSIMWRFPTSAYGEIKGLNEAGVETFSSNSLRSLVRESVQNSLDAMLNEAVYVTFEEQLIDSMQVPGMTQLQQELRACHSTGADKSDDTQRFFSNAMRVAKQKKIRVMKVSDYGTTGLRGADKHKTGTDWSRLIKESGSSNKGGSSGGSFGIGKYSSFACSDLRTVFFSSRDDTDYESHIGVARLISSRDAVSGQLTNGIGYYSGSEKNVAIPGQLAFGGATERTSGESGTDFYIIGFKCTGDVTQDIIKNVLTDFLVSIWKGKLSVSVNGIEVNKQNLGKHVSALNEYDSNPLVKETIEHYDLLTQSGSSTTVIEFHPNDLRKPGWRKKFRWGKGCCRLFLKQGDDSLNREVTITRAAGMRLFNQNRISGSIRFTGILMIEGKKINSDFKKMEAPSHDEWSAERAPDQKLAEQMIIALRQWVKDKVEESFAVKIEDQMEAFGTALYLPKREESDKGEGESEEETLSARVKIVKQTDITPRRNERVVSVRAGVTPDPDGDAVRKGQGHASKKGKPRSGSAPGEDDGFTRIEVRQRLICTDPKSGEYKLTFTTPHKASKVRIQLCIQGEQNEESVNVTAADAVVGKRRGASFNGSQIQIENVEAGAQASVTFRTDFPHYCMMGADYYESK